MRTIIAGSRGCDSYTLLIEAVDIAELFGITPSLIVSGGARGVDRLGERFARERQLRCQIYRPNWNEFGLGAGHIRNRLMADNADALIALWDGQSKGTKNMIETAHKLKLSVYVHPTPAG